MGQRLEIQFNSQAIQAYLAVPEAGRGPGVLVLHAWWGLTGFIQEFCQRLANEGFVALAPDYYHGGTAATIEEAKQLRSGLDREVARREIAAWLEHLGAHPAVSGPTLGEIGFSLGGNFALQLAEEKPRKIGAVVVFYGARTGKFIKTRAAFLGHFAEEDAYVSAETVEKLEENLRQAGLEVDCYVYPGTQHWFFEEDRIDSYQEVAASLAWDRTVDFLREKLLRS
jgi:carboxymethylenebutenolidase